MYYSDDYFKSKKLILAGGNSIIKTDHYVYVAKAHTKKPGMVRIYVSRLRQGFIKYLSAQLPFDAVSSRSFTVIDASEWSAFLHV